MLLTTPRFARRRRRARRRGHPHRFDGFANAQFADRDFTVPLITPIQPRVVHFPIPRAALRRSPADNLHDVPAVVFPSRGDVL